MLDGGVPDGIVLAGCETVSVMGQPGWLVAGALLDCAVLPSGLTSKLVGFLVEPNWLQETTSRVTTPPPPRSWQICRSHIVACMPVPVNVLLVMTCAWKALR